MQIKRGVIGHNATQFGGTGSIDFIFNIEDTPPGGLPQWVAPYHLVAIGTVNGQPLTLTFGVLSSPTPDPTEIGAVVNELPGFPVGSFTLTLYDANNVVVSSMASPLIFSPPFATLNGIVHTGGLNTDYHFEIGVSATPPVYGTVIAGGTVPGTVLSQPVSQQLNETDLVPETTYDYRLVQSSGGQVSKSANAQFTTPGYFFAEIKPATNIS